jgi:hypothetical protein
VLGEYVEHYNGARPHRGLQLHPPNGEIGLVPQTGKVSSNPRLGGLLREYRRLGSAA